MFSISTISFVKKKLKLIAYILILYRLFPSLIKNIIRKYSANILRLVADIIDVKNLVDRSKSLSMLTLSKHSSESVDIPENTSTLVIQQSYVSQFPLHAHSASLNQAFTTTLNLSPLSSWTIVQKNKSIQIYTKFDTRLVNPLVRGVGEFDTTFTIQEWIAVIRSGDARYDQSRVVDQMNSTDTLTLSIQKGTFPVAARELLVAQSLRLDSSSKSYLIQVSVEDAREMVVDSGRVRADLIIGSWTLSKSADILSVDYIVGIDFKGTVPDYIVQKVQLATPMCVENVYSYLKLKNAIPFVVKYDLEYKHLVSTSISKMGEVFDDVKRVLTLSFEINVEDGKIDNMGTVCVALSYGYKDMTLISCRNDEGEGSDDYTIDMIVEKEVSGGVIYRLKRKNIVEKVKVDAKYVVDFKVASSGIPTFNGIDF